MRIALSPFWAKTILMLNSFRRLLIMCKGYDGDDENFTELVWKDDKSIDLAEGNSGTS